MSVLPQGLNQDQPDWGELALDPRSALLEPASWRASLETYGTAMHLAVALAGDNGLLTEVINPQPTWRLFRASQPARVGECPFSLSVPNGCTCMADALAANKVVLAHDRTGLVHFAVPLVLNGQPLGALLAGQIFDSYPDQAVLTHLAKKFRLPAGEVWRLARRECPISKATLLVYGDLLLTFGATFLQTRYHTNVEANRLAEVTRLRDLLEDRARELTEADRRKDEFLAVLAHELRNPLAPIRNAARIMGLFGQDEAQRLWASNIVERQVQHLTQLIDDLLDVSRITNGKIHLKRQVVDLVELISHAVETSRLLIDERRQKLEIAIPAEPIWTEVDAVRIAQVVSNLLNNAAKFTADSGRIWLSAAREKDEAVVRVRDNGIGIAADMLPRVFDLFAQGSNSLVHTSGGLGIGLTLVRGLAEMHGGSVQAFSNGVGQGSEFVVRLPMISETCRPEMIVATGSPAPLSPRRILVVDDNVDAAETLARILQMSGHEVRTAHDGLAALEAERAFQPQVVLLDIGLPNMDGYEVARRIRRQTGRNVRLVALTGYGREEDRRRAEEAGFDVHVVKPLNLSALGKLVIGD